ncbi:MAG: hypothetical protein AAF726_16980 [Planctomycetota bacterium]
MLWIGALGMLWPFVPWLRLFFGHVRDQPRLAEALYDPDAPTFMQRVSYGVMIGLGIAAIRTGWEAFRFARGDHAE